MNTKTAIAGLSIFVLLGMTSMGTLGDGDKELTCWEATYELLGSIGYEFEDRVQLVDSSCDDIIVEYSASGEFRGVGVAAWTTEHSIPETGADRVSVEWYKSGNNHFEVGDYIALDSGIYTNHAIANCEKIAPGVWSGSFWVQGEEGPCETVKYQKSAQHIRYGLLKLTVHYGGFHIAGNDMMLEGPAVATEFVEL